MKNPLAILELRLAKGEICIEEFEKLKKNLEEYKYCPHCGTKIPSVSKFCIECGNKLV